MSSVTLHEKAFKILFSGQESLHGDVSCNVRKGHGIWKLPAAADRIKDKAQKRTKLWNLEAA